MTAPVPPFPEAEPPAVHWEPPPPPNPPQWGWAHRTHPAADTLERPWTQPWEHGQWK